MYLDVVVGIGMKENRLLYRISQFAFNSDAETVPHIHTPYTHKHSKHSANSRCSGITIENRSATEIERNETANDVISVYFIHDPFCFSRQFVRHPLITM